MKILERVQTEKRLARLVVDEVGAGMLLESPPMLKSSGPLYFGDRQILSLAIKY
jgi:hypothetical protein